jgi:hypothetical protein
MVALQVGIYENAHESIHLFPPVYAIALDRIVKRKIS